MNINRHNYEEYFLLYIDNELSIADKNMVEAFIAANPDLGEELVMLQQSIVKPEKFEFPGKEALLKPLTVDESTEEKLLLLLDNELPENEKDEILALTSSNESVRKEWALLQTVKLSAADKIIFEDKSLLYRRETKVIPVAWWRMAAAAMLIGFGLWGAVSYLNKNTGKPGIETVNTLPAKTQPAVTTPQTQIPAITDDKNTTTVANTVEESSVKSAPAVQATSSKSSLQTTMPVKNNNTVAANENEEENKNNITSANENNINSDDSNKKMIVSVSPETSTIKPENKFEIPSSSSKNEYAVNTSFNNSAGTQNFDTFEEEEEKPKKTKLGGFFKRVKRVIERKTKIKTGNDDEVKIANMSFAMN